MLANSIHSEARLRFSWGEAEAKTKLIERSLGGLCHLSKGYWDGGMVMLQLVNPTAGMFAGDSLELSIELDARAQVAITSPSATRFHTMKDAESACLSQSITIGDKAFLEYWPEMVIPQRGSSTVQETVLQIHGGGSVLFFDAVAPGRVAHNEVNAYRSYLNSIDVYVGGALKARERLKNLSVAVGGSLSRIGTRVTWQHYGSTQRTQHLQKQRFQGLFQLWRKSTEGSVLFLI